MADAGGKGRRHLGTQRAKIEDVARAAGVSPATVSRALRDLPHVADSTRSKIVATASALGYRPHTPAAQLASGKAWSIGLVAPFFGIWYTGRVLAGVQHQLARAGYDLMVYPVDTPENRARLLERIPSLGTRVDGLVLVDYFPNGEELAALVASRIECVAVGQLIESMTSLAVDNQRAAMIAVEHLLDLGHRRIAVLGHTQMYADQSPILAARLRGYRRALTSAGIELDKSLELAGSLATSGGRAGLDRMMNLADRPTALLCLSDETAMGAIAQARTLGIHISGELSVVGIDDHDLSAEFGLTTVRQPVWDIGTTAATMLLDAVESDDDTGMAHRLIDARLIVRETTSAPSC